MPTLGERGYPALLERLQASTSQPDEQHFISRLIGQAIVKIGERSPEFARSRALDLIHKKEFVFRAAGLHILKELPDSRAVDPLWTLHKQYFQALSGSSGIEGHLRCDLSFSALRACVQLTPQWLAEKIRDAVPAVDPVSELAWLLCGLKRPEAKDLWYQLKTILFEKVAPDKPRSLICCIGRFKDREELPRVIGWLNCQDDFAQPAAFSALCQLDPGAALNAVQELDDEQAALTSSWWLPELLFRIPQIAHERLLAVAKQRRDGHCYLADIYAGHENLIDGTTLEFYLDALEAELASHPAHSIAEGVPGITHCLRLLANIHRPDLLRVIEARAHTPLAALISKVAQNQLPHCRFTMDPLFEEAREVLNKLGGQNLTDLINSELASHAPQIRQMGMADALRRTDDRTRMLLRSIAQSEELCGSPPQPAEQRRAIEVLAALGDEESVIQGVLRWGQHISQSLFSYWNPQRPIEVTSLSDVMHALTGNSNVDNALIAAGMSGNRQFVPVVQQVLRQALPERQTAWYAATALIALDDKSEEFVELLIPLLETPDNGHWAMEYLSRIGSSRALEALVQHLQAVGTNPLSRYDWGLAVDLSRRVETRGRMNKLIADRIRAGNDLWLKYEGRYLEILPELGLDDAYDILLEEAFASNPHVPVRVLGAITGLWKLDPPTALHATELGLQRLPKIKDHLPRLLVELAGDQAITVLCRHMSQEESSATRWCIARALRLVSDSESLNQHIREMLFSQQSLTREVAIEICGWQPPGFMQDTLNALAGEDFSDIISRKAIEALQRQKEQRWVEQLMREFQSDPTSRRWSLLTSILQLGDSYVLKDRRDRLWIGQILAGTHEGYWEFVKKAIPGRERAVLDYAKRIDRGKR